MYLIVIKKFLIVPKVDRVAPKKILKKILKKIIFKEKL